MAHLLPLLRLLCQDRLAAPITVEGLAQNAPHCAERGTQVTLSAQRHAAVAWPALTLTDAAA